MRRSSEHAGSTRRHQRPRDPGSALAPYLPNCHTSRRRTMSGPRDTSCDPCSRGPIPCSGGRSAAGDSRPRFWPGLPRGWPPRQPTKSTRSRPESSSCGASSSSPSKRFAAIALPQWHQPTYSSSYGQSTMISEWLPPGSSAFICTRFRRGPDRSPEDLFKDAVSPFLRRAWPLESRFAIPAVSRWFASLPALCAGEFARAVAAVERFLVSIRRSHARHVRPFGWRDSPGSAGEDRRRSTQGPGSPSSNGPHHRRFTWQLPLRPVNGSGSREVGPTWPRERPDLSTARSHDASIVPMIGS